ncbi:MAG: hypothetical protein IJS60_03645 [Abditibacteriota bacterium]|nr:hypothetical protein [Abditibacteriota bacterium]
MGQNDTGSRNYPEATKTVTTTIIDLGLSYNAQSTYTCNRMYNSKDFIHCINNVNIQLPWRHHDEINSIRTKFNHTVSFVYSCNCSGVNR